MVSDAITTNQVMFTVSPMINGISLIITPVYEGHLAPNTNILSVYYIMFGYISVLTYSCNKYISECIPLFNFLMGAKVTVAFTSKPN